jgi:MFS family permease
MTALADRRFRRLLIGNSISSFGDSALYLTLGVWVKDLTGSNAAAGAIFLAQGLPYLAAPFAGQLVDRMNRRRLLIIANALTGTAVLALLVVHSASELWVMYLVSFGYGLAGTIITPAGAGLLKDLLPDHDLAGANAANVTIRQGLRLVSPLIGTALYAQFGGGCVAVVDAISFLAAIAALACVRVQETAPAQRGEQSVRAELLAGITHLRRTPLLSQITLTAAAAYLVIGFYESATFAVIAAIGRPAAFFGVLMSVQAAGSIAGGLGVGFVIRRVGETRTLGIALAAWSLASIVYLIPHVAASCAALTLFGVAIPLAWVSVDTATQRHTPQQLQGRVFAASNMASGLAQTLSIAVGATLVDTLGYQPLLLTVAAVTALAAVPVLTRPAQPPPDSPKTEAKGGLVVSDPLGEN